MTNENILEELLTMDIKYALLKNFVGVLNTRIAEYETEQSEEALQKIIRDTELFLDALKTLGG